jgi:hypothetical protein
MKKIIFFLTLVFVSNNVFFSQNISGEVEYEISSWECKYCRLPGKKKVLKSILKVSDYRYLHQLFFAAEKEEGKFGCVEYSWNHCSLSTNVNQVHSIIEIDIPVTEKKSFMNISKSENKIAYLSENDLFRLSQVSQKINSEYTKWKKICDEEQAKKHTEKVKEQKEKEIAKKAKIEEQRLKFIPVFDSLIDNKNFKEASLLISQNENSIERELLVEIKKGYHDSLVSFLNDLLNRYDFQTFDSEYNNLESRLDISEKNEFEKNRIFKSIECEVNKIKATTISQEELLLVGDWSFVDINTRVIMDRPSGYTMRIILKSDRSFECISNWKLQQHEDYLSLWHNDFYEKLELKGFWKLNKSGITLIANEEFGDTGWEKTRQPSRFFEILDFKKNKLYLNHQIPKCSVINYQHTNFAKAFVIEFKGKRSKEK